jgi:tRNA G37 N-methylase Trm5
LEKEKQVAKYLLSIHPSVKTILAKASAHKGIYRLQSYRFVAGVKSFETVYIEQEINTQRRFPWA